MGLLEKLWDDTVAGPRPDSGLGRLRKYNTFSFRSNSGGRESNGNEKSYGEEATATAPTVDIPVRVSRSITIVKPPGYTGSAPASPAGGTPPPSPFSGECSFSLPHSL
uniref:Uncharacterized protein n=1 Tax=Opuntia streptacantha TaxID=393608 RepID=A0A7C9CQW2_OPUST